MGYLLEDRFAFFFLGLGFLRWMDGLQPID
jgi:hypothetical protein